MPMVQQITTTGYECVAPTLDKVRKTVPLLDRAVQRIEPITVAVIQKTDGYVDAGYKVVEGRVDAVRGTISSVKGSVYQKASPVVDKVVDLKVAATGKVLKIYNENPMILKAHQTGLSLCDSTEALIDRWLPEPATTANKQGEKKDKEGKDAIVLYRMIALPLRIPARTIHIVAFKIDGITQEIVVRAKWAVQLTKDQKSKLSTYIADSSRQLMDKVSNSTAIVTLKKGKTAGARKLEIAKQSLADGQHAIAVKCYTVCERFGLVELKDLTFEKIDQVQCLALSTAKSASNGAYTLTKRVAGDERATLIFTKIGEKVPLVKSAIYPEASTGSLEAVVPPPAPACLTAGTGDTLRVSVVQQVEQQDFAMKPQLNRSPSVEVPLVKSAIYPEASTGSLEAMVPPPAPACLTAGTGDTPRVSVVQEVEQEDVAMKPQLNRSPSVEADQAAVE